MERKLFELDRVLVDRGKAVVRADVPAHEVVVLQAIHGEVEVRPVESGVGTVELETDVGAEWARLSRTYYRPNAPDAVRRAFPEGPKALIAYGFTDANAKPKPVPKDRKAA